MKVLRVPVVYGLLRALVAFALFQWVFGTPVVKSATMAALFGVVCGIGIWAQRGRVSAPGRTLPPNGAREPLT